MLYLCKRAVLNWPKDEDRECESQRGESLPRDEMSQFTTPENLAPMAYRCTPSAPVLLAFSANDSLLRNNTRGHVVNETSKVDPVVCKSSSLACGRTSRYMWNGRSATNMTGRVARHLSAHAFARTSHTRQVNEEASFLHSYAGSAYCYSNSPLSHSPRSMFARSSMGTSTST